VNVPAAPVPDPRDTFVKLARADDIEIVGTPPGVILVCGGAIASAEQPPTSIRDFFLRHLDIHDPATAGKIILAEDVNDWMNEGVYDELFTFERHLAELAAVIVIFVESAGSIAELGAFSHLEGVADKLLVFLSEAHDAQLSFIRLGPVKYLEVRHSRTPHIYPWVASNGVPLSYEQQQNLNQFIGEMCTDLSDAIESVRIERTINPKRPRDQMLAI
jgi:hypothetical protein